MTTAAAAIAPTMVMLVFALLWLQSQRHLRRAWARETEYQRIIADLMRLSRGTAREDAP